jgi:calcium-dependent protein kinase
VGILQPENLIFSDQIDEHKHSDAHIKIIDFGCAVEVSKFTRTTEMAGTPWYLAPEMLLSPVTRSVSVVSATKDVKLPTKKQAGVEICQCDMWSVGVIVFFMLTGRLPFDGPTKTQVYQAIVKAQYEYPENIDLSKNAKDFIEKLLTIDWQKRMTCAQALAHPWISEGGASDLEFRKGYFEAMNIQQNKVKLRSAVERLLVNRMKEDDADVLKSRISKFQKDKNGLLDSSKVLSALDTIRKSIRVSFSPKRSTHSYSLSPNPEPANPMSPENKIADEDEEVIRMLFASLDHDGSGMIDPEELSKALLSQIDESEDQGGLDWDEVSKARGTTRKKLQTNLMTEIFQDSDINGDGKISMDEFLVAMGNAFKA